MEERLDEIRRVGAAIARYQEPHWGSSSEAKQPHSS